MTALILAIAVFAQPELLERTLALVGGQPITLGDTRAATQLGLLDANLSPSSDVLSRMIDRELIMREVQRYDPTRRLNQPSMRGSMRFENDSPMPPA